MHVYMGIPIHRNAVAGNRFRWWSFTYERGSLTANTISEMKQLIRSTLAGGR